MTIGITFFLQPQEQLYAVHFMINLQQFLKIRQHFYSLKDSHSSIVTKRMVIEPVT